MFCSTHATAAPTQPVLQPAPATQPMLHPARHPANATACCCLPPPLSQCHSLPPPLSQCHSLSPPLSQCYSLLPPLSQPLSLLTSVNASLSLSYFQTSCLHRVFHHRQVLASGYNTLQSPEMSWTIENLLSDDSFHTPISPHLSPESDRRAIDQ